MNLKKSVLTLGILSAALGVQMSHADYIVQAGGAPYVTVPTIEFVQTVDPLNDVQPISSTLITPNNVTLTQFDPSTGLPLPGATTTLSATGLTTGTVNAGNVLTNAVSANTVDVGSVTAGTIDASYVTSSTGFATSGTVSANNVNSNTVSANSISLNGRDLQTTIDTTFTAANNYTDFKSAQTLTSANSYTNTKTAETLTAANGYTDTKAAETLTAANGYTDTKTAQTLTSANTFTTNAVTTEANARIAGDAATLTAANNYTNSQVSHLSSRLDNVEKTAYRGIAISLAAQQSVPNIQPGQVAMFGGMGFYQSESAGALGLVTLLPNGRTSLSAAVGVSGNEVGGRVGVSYVFGK